MKMKVQLLAVCSLSISLAFGQVIGNYNFITLLDYLDGAGLFTSKTKFESSWKIVNSTAYTFSL
jgi:hypothetical protein